MNFESQFSRADKTQEKIHEQALELASNLLQPYNQFVFLVHPLFHQIDLVSLLNSHQEVFRQYAKPINTYTDEEFEMWRKTVSPYTVQCDIVSIRRSLQGLSGNYKEMYKKYRELTQNVPEDALLIIIPAIDSNNKYFAAAPAIYKRYKQFASSYNVQIPNPENITQTGRHYTPPNMRFSYPKDIAQWIFEATAGSKPTNEKVRNAVLELWKTNKEEYFGNKEFSVAGEYENLCVKLTAGGIDMLTGKQAVLLSEYSFKADR